MCRLRHINDPVLSSLKMEGKHLVFLNIKIDKKINLCHAMN
jgi:hypothetical protein